MIKALFKDFICHSRACAHCGALWGKTDLFCEGCWSIFEKFLSEKLETPRYPFPVRALFAWEKTELRSLKSQLLLSLKGGDLPEAFTRLAWYFAQRDPSPPQRPLIFIPAPARAPENKDHAYQWAEALAAQYGGRVSPVLRRVDSGEQKSKNLQEREKNKMSLVGCFDPEAEVILADDLIASGNTVRAGYEALGEPKNFSVWAIAHRPKQAG